MSPTFHILVFLLIVLICSIPLATFAQQDSIVAENEILPAVLLIGDHHGVDEIDVWQAALLVAKELRRHDIFVGDPVSFYEAPAAEIVYYVVLRRSDEKILFRLSKKNSTGTVIIEQEMLLADIEDIGSAAPRLVDALVHREPVTSSLRFISTGIFRTLVPVEGIGASGNKIGLIHDEPTYAVGIEFRYADGETGYRRRGPNQSYGEQANFLKFGSLSIGGRYFSFNKWSISPYIGGGLTVIGIEYETIVRRAHFSSVGTSLWDALVSLGQSNPSWDYDIRSESNFGMGAYGVCGIEFRKFRNHRLKLELRMDRPFFKLPSRDLMPITVGITYFTSSLFGCLGGGWSFLFKSPFE